jgi:hypothetical protein
VCPKVLFWDQVCFSYINDIPDGITSTVRLFADNTIAYLIIKSNRDCTTLQNDLDKLSTCIWEQKWKKAFHPDKCNVLSITRNKTPVKHTYTPHGHQLEHADKAKYLGVTIQSDLKWDEGRIQDFKLKLHRAVGGANIFGVFRVKNHDFTPKKSYFFHF